MKLVAFSICFTLTMFMLSRSQQFVCPSGWIYAKEKCWIFRQDSLTWAEARLECLKFGGDLASIVSEEDNHQLYHIRNGILSQMRQANRRKLAQPVSTNVNLTCFEKQPMSLLVGFAEVVLNVPTEEQCLNECYNSQATYGIQCKSLMYYPDSKDCIVNTESRTTKPDLFTKDNSGLSVNYYDNNCPNPIGSICYITTNETALYGFAEQVVTGTTPDQCKTECTGSKTKYNFICNSATYYTAQQSCILTKENRASQSQLIGPDPGATYFERTTNCPGTNNGPCNNTNMDLLLVVDSSGSVGPQSFENVRQFLKSMVQTFKVNPNGVNVGLVQFNEMPKTEFHLKSYQTNEEVLAAIDGMKWMGGYTLIGKALKYTLENEMTAAQGDRNPVPNVVVVLTDGMSQDNPTSAAQRLRSAGVITYAVGVTEAVSDEQLLNIAGSPDRVYKVKNFNRLDDRLRDQILKDVCNPPKPQPITPSICYPSPSVSCMPTGGYGGYPSGQVSYPGYPSAQVPSAGYPSAQVPSGGFPFAQIPFGGYPTGQVPSGGVGGYPPSPVASSNNYGGPPATLQPPPPVDPTPPTAVCGLAPCLTAATVIKQPQSSSSLGRNFKSPGSLHPPSPLPQPPSGRHNDFPKDKPESSGNIPTEVGNEFHSSRNIRHTGNSLSKKSKRDDLKSSTSSENGIWLGLTDQFLEGKFIWVDGQNVNYTNWKFSKPIKGAKENCVVSLIEQSQRWMNINCSLRNSFLCKRNATIINERF